MADTTHAALIEALDRGEVAGIGKAQRIDTLAAHVFLAGDHAHKLKRPVAFSFLDFRTADQRRRALEAELRLNKRTAPDLYLAVLPITYDGQHYALDGEGAAIEWVLLMRRFPADAQLDRIAAAGALPPAVAVALGRSVAHLHGYADIRTARGGVAAMREVVLGNRQDLDAVSPGLFETGVIDIVDGAARLALVRHTALLEARRRRGLVRRCHGDLHLGNIVALGDRVVPFDCIEFSEDFACVDTMYDLAFLLMDLVERGQRPAAWLVLDAYLDERRDLEGLALLPFYMAVRATIRAKVTALAVDPERPETDAVDRARRYLDLAAAFLPAPAPRLIAIGGLSGTGKTTLARALAPLIDPAPGALLVRSDVERKRLAGVPEIERLDAWAYTPERNAACFAELRDCAARALAGGWSVVVDAVHGRPEERAVIEQAARAAGIRFDGLWLEAPAGTLVQRVGERRDDASDADAAVVRGQLEMDVGPLTWRRVDAEGTIDGIVESLLGPLDLNATTLAPPPPRTNVRS